MSTVQELFRRGASLLHSFPRPLLEAKVLLRKATSLTDEKIFTSSQKKLSRREERTFYKLVARRLAGFPLAYLTGVKEFWSIPFLVFPGVLIPRPETELIVERVLELSSRGPELIIDIGTGCGNIAIALAKELPQARFVATDTSPKALRIARLNASEQEVDRITFLRSNLFSALKKMDLEGKCDFIVSNPPYVTDEEWKNLPAGMRNHEPRKALVAGITGFEVIDPLIMESGPFLKPDGHLLFEIGEGQHARILSFFGEGWKEVRVDEDLRGIPRVIIACKA